MQEINQQTQKNISLYMYIVTLLHTWDQTILGMFFRIANIFGTLKCNWSSKYSLNNVVLGIFPMNFQF